MRNSTRLVRWLAVPTLALLCSAAPAAVSCEQLAQLALSTERLRDQGYPLAQITQDIDGLVANGQFSAIEIAGMQKAVKDAFLRARTSNEIFVECRESMNK